MRFVVKIRTYNGSYQTPFGKKGIKWSHWKPQQRFPNKALALEYVNDNQGKVGLAELAVFHKGKKVKD